MSVLLLIISSIIYISPAYAKGAAEKESTLITSDSMIADTKNNVVTFTGSVKLVRGGLTLYADKMDVFYRTKGGAIKDVIASGNIKLVKANGVITSEAASYDAGEEKIIFTGNPRAVEGRNTITGTKIEYFIKNDRSVVENSRVHILN